MSNIFWAGRPTNFKLRTQTEHEDPHQRQAPWPPRSKIKVTRSRDASDKCWPISREWNVRGRPKLVGILSTPREIMRCRFKVKGQRSKVKVTRPINAETGSASHLQTSYTDGARRPASATSAVTSKVKDQGHKVTWCVWQMLADKSRTKRQRKTKIGRNIVHSTRNNALQIQGQRSEVKGQGHQAD